MEVNIILILECFEELYIAKFIQQIKTIKKEKKKTILTHVTVIMS